MAHSDLSPSLYGQPAAPTGFVPDFEGRLTDWSAAAFGSETEACEDMPVHQRLFCLSMMVLASAPIAYVGGVARLLLVG